MFGSLEFYRFQEKQAEATLVAIPTLTAESLEFLYQKGLGYINIGQWQEARATLQSVFEINPNYKNVQEELKVVNAKMVQLKLTPRPLPTISPTPRPASVKSSVSVNGLVAYYPFNGNANDESGNGYNGDVTGAVLVRDRFGTPKSAYGFNGRSDYIHINMSADQFANDFTVLAWVKFNNFNNDYPQILNGDNHSFVLHGMGPVYNDKKRRIVFYQQIHKEYRQGERIGQLETVKPLETNRWYLITIRRNELEFSAFVDGVFQVETVSEQSIPLTGASLYIGADIPGGDDVSGHIDGSIDDVRIFDRALTQEEIRDFYQEGDWGAIQ